MKKNCWEVKKCGRCLAGVGDAACPVCKETRAHGIHGGVNGGRACWTISHTKCEGTTQGAFGAKFRNCKDCDFYNLVRQEEKSSFQLSATILAKLGK